MTLRAGAVAVTAVDGSWFRHIPPQADPFFKPASPPDNRWQRAQVVDAYYVSSGEETVHAEWYRTICRAGIAPLAAVPFDVVRLVVRLARVADLSSADLLERVGLQPPRTGQDWYPYQEVGESLYRQGFDGLLAPTDAHRGGRVLCVFRPGRAVPGMVGDVERTSVTEPPLLPVGLLT